MALTESDTLLLAAYKVMIVNDHRQPILPRIEARLKALGICPPSEEVEEEESVPLEQALSAGRDAPVWQGAWNIPDYTLAS